MKLETTALILAGAVIVSVLATAAFFYLSQEYEVQELGMHLQVLDYYGFNISTEGVVFGTIPPGVSGSRTITVSSTEPKHVVIGAEGELAKWVSVSENSFLIQGNESKNVSVSVSVPEGAEFGNYTGTLKILFFAVR